MTGRRTRVGVTLAVALLVSSIGAAGASAATPQADDGMSALRQLASATRATARYLRPAAAKQAGWGRPPAPAPLHECISSLDDTGAMGIHLINGALLDTTLDPRKPEALVYARSRHGNLRLVALEYVVFKADWDAAHPSEMPMLFGQEFMETLEPNRYEIPAFYALHVWLYKYNPAGLFEGFNPRVSCGSTHASADAQTSPSGRARMDSRSPADASARLAVAGFVCGIRRAAALTA